METQFIYLREDTKFWIVSSIVGIAILILVFLSGPETKDRAKPADVTSGEIKYYSKILGIDSTGDYWSSDVFNVDLQSWNKWQRGDMAYAANTK